jgi:hypothetical protein
MRFDTRPTVAIIIGVVFVYLLQYIYVDISHETYGNVSVKNMYNSNKSNKSNKKRKNNKKLEKK